MKKIMAFACLLFATACLAQTAQVIRGPYLQILTPTSVTVRWRTDKPADSRVLFGTSQTLNKDVVSEELTTEHDITLTGLTPDTRYNYAFGATHTQLTIDEDQYFKTAPPKGSVKPVRIWSLGDFGNSSKNQMEVRDAITKATATHRPDVWIWLGDNAYTKGKDEEFQKHVFDLYEKDFFKNLPFFATPGNHDYGDKNNKDIPYFKIFNMPQQGEAGGIASGSESYFSFEYGNVHLVSLDCEGKLEDGKFLSDTTSNQVQWLKKDLAANTLPWTIVFFHRPPYSKGSHDSDTEEEMIKIRQNLLPILEKYNVDIVFSGHSHVYERTHPIIGHYGMNNSFDPARHIVEQKDTDNHYHLKGKKQGIIYIVNGSGGQLGGQEPGYPLKSAVYSNNKQGGSVILDVVDNKLEARWICADGVVRDQFSIIKEK